MVNYYMCFKSHAHFVLERLQASQMESLEYIIQVIGIDKILS